MVQGMGDHPLTLKKEVRHVVLERFWRFCRARLSARDPGLLVCSCVLSLSGILTLIGGVGHFGTRTVIMQIGATLVGFVAMVVLANLDYRPIADKLSPVLYGVSVLLMLLLFVNGESAGSNRSWLYFDFLPFGIQPSEFIKTALAVSFAYHLSRVKERINRPLVALGLAAHAGGIILLILLTGDLGVAVVFAGFILLMMFCAGLSLWYFAGLAVLVAAAFPILWDHLAPYQQQRILIGFNPSLDPLGYGYQPLLSRDAIMAGGFFGQGLGGGDVYEILPYSHTDFIYSTLCEKMGFVAGFIVLAALFTAVVRMIWIAARSERDTGSYLCVGLAACLMLQVVINVGMCFAVLPVIGITLPLVSYGGSSVLATYLMFGMVHSVSAHRNRSSSIWN